MQNETSTDLSLGFSIKAKRPGLRQRVRNAIRRFIVSAIVADCRANGPIRELIKDVSEGNA
jgi:hypothetical protein